MGRYYNGDIDGKFWFGVQSSDDADFFGSIGEPSGDLNYRFEADDLDDVERGVAECKTALGDYLPKLDEFFQNRTGYTDELLADFLGTTLERSGLLLEWYARLELGIKIFDCLKEHGVCNFFAEV